MYHDKAPVKAPKIGILALLLPDYEPLFPGIAERQGEFVRSLIRPFDESGEIEFVFDRPAAGREDIKEAVCRYNVCGLDGILILLLSYAQGQYVERALRDNRLPVGLALVQPDETVGDDFEEIDLTVNQGIHGSQDVANCLTRAGVKFACFAGGKSGFGDFARDFAMAAKAASALRSMRVGVIGKLPGMGDVVTDDMAVYRALGPEFVYDSIGALRRLADEVSDDDIDVAVARDYEVFNVDPNITDEQLRYAERLYLAIRRYVEDNGYSGYTVQFSEFGEDGRFRQLPMLAASHMLADGYGYAAEGDATCAALVAAMQILCGPANFSEMYMMDLKRGCILFCHGGEGNWRVARRDKKPRLIDRALGEGGLGNPPTAVFAPEPGKAAALSLVHCGGEQFKLVAATGEVVDKDDLRRIEMPYMFFRPYIGAANMAARWLEEGGTHHEAVIFGDVIPRLKIFCRLLGVRLSLV